MRFSWLSCVLSVFLILGFATVSDAAQHERLTRPFGAPTGGGEAPLGSFVADPGFEAGAFGGIWDEMSTNFGTPICDEFSCGLGGGSGPDSGSWWAWFGGIEAFEEGSVAQAVTVPATDDVTLSFRLETPVCSGDTNDFMEVLIDGSQVFLVRGDDAMCDVVGYRTVTVDISDQVVSNTFDLEFHSISMTDDGLAMSRDVLKVRRNLRSGRYRTDR